MAESPGIILNNVADLKIAKDIPLGQQGIVSSLIAVAETDTDKSPDYPHTISTYTIILVSACQKMCQKVSLTDNL